jgi:hypothetical protein
VTSEKTRKRGDGRQDAAARFDTLRGFFRGYLHQDFRAEHGSAEEAARAYRSVASATELRALVAEWAEFSAAVGGMRWRDVKIALVRELGSSWQPVSRREFERFGSVLTGQAP